MANLHQLGLQPELRDVFILLEKWRIGLRQRRCRLWNRGSALAERDWLAEAIGSCLARTRGLVAVYTPEGVASGVSETIVRSINAAEPSTPPKAILVSRDVHDQSDQNCLRLSPHAAICVYYRDESGVAVVDGRHPDLASFVQTFIEGGPDGPRGNQGPHLWIMLRVRHWIWFSTPQVCGTPLWTSIPSLDFTRRSLSSWPKHTRSLLREH